MLQQLAQLAEVESMAFDCGCGSKRKIDPQVSLGNGKDRSRRLDINSGSLLLEIATRITRSNCYCDALAKDRGSEYNSWETAFKKGQKAAEEF